MDGYIDRQLIEMIDVSRQVGRYKQMIVEIDDRQTDGQIYGKKEGGRDGREGRKEERKKDWIDRQIDRWNSFILACSRSDKAPPSEMTKPILVDLSNLHARAVSHLGHFSWLHTVLVSVLSPHACGRLSSPVTSNYFYAVGPTPLSHYQASYQQSDGRAVFSFPQLPPNVLITSPFLGCLIRKKKIQILLREKNGTFSAGSYLI